MSASLPVHTLKRWVFTLTVAGYPVFGLLAALLDLNSALTTIPFRLGLLVLSLLLFCQAKDRHDGHLSQALLWIFWFLYGLRLLWDVAVADVPGALDAAVFFVLAVLVPCAAMSRTTLDGQEAQLAWLLAVIGGGTCLLAAAMHFLQLGQARSLTEQTGRLFFEAVNPITLGHAAVTTLIALLCVARAQPARLRMALMALAGAAALACLVLTASRGPALVLVICAAVFIWRTGHWRLMLVGALLMLPLLLGEISQLEARFTDIEYDESALERIMLQTSALAQFQLHPFLGSAFVEPIMGTYPHNIFIETAMALGVVGLALLTAVLGMAGLRMLRRLRAGELLVPLLFLQYLLAAQLSGAIYGNAALWVTTVALLFAGRGAQARGAGRTGMRAAPTRGTSV